jgi:hypothetical protein
VVARGILGIAGHDRCSGARLMPQWEG